MRKLIMALSVLLIAGCATTVKIDPSERHTAIRDLDFTIGQACVYRTFTKDECAHLQRLILALYETRQGHDHEILEALSILIETARGRKNGSQYFSQLVMGLARVRHS